MESQKLLAQRAAEQLVEHILVNQMAAGTKLPNEFELAQLLNVGRSTVREAVKSLVSRNVLEVRHGAGTFVVEKNLGVSYDPLGLTFIQDKEKLVLDLLEIRMSLEPRIAGLAAMNATQEQIAQMQETMLEVEALIHAGENHLEKDVLLHTQIAQSSGNLVVPNLIPIIQQSVTMFVDATHRKLLQETIVTHRAIVESIAARDSMAASDGMVLHIVYNRDNIHKVFAKRRAEAEMKDA